MTHFVGLVVAETREEIDALLAPFHEFECTGRDDEYVVDVDKTEEARERYAKETDPSDSFEDWAADYYGTPIVASEAEIDRSETHKYGFILKVGDDVKIIDRTNPNKRWDWWVVGGRWGDVIPGHSCLVEEVTKHFTEYLPSALIDAEGWHEAKSWGWFGLSAPTETPEIVSDKLATLAGKRVWVVDFHI